ncbi:MAG: hypothetical protein EBU40_13335 [Proteobacteria bacterium]|nr:hypothetical protein [Pseudomonadota bacterium]
MRPMSTDKPVRVALLGCGAIAQAHLRAIAANPGVVEVAGIYDADRSRAEARAAEFHVAHIYNTWHDVLASDADVIAVLLPHDLHAKFAVEVLEAGHHVVVEKPLATTLAECDAILNAAAKACSKIRQLSVAPLFAETIQRIARGESVMSLFSEQDKLF